MLAVVVAAATNQDFDRAATLDLYAISPGARPLQVPIALYRQAPFQTGPKGPSAELIAAVMEMKRRNPKFGYLKIAQQISHAFGIELNKDVVRRILQQ
jgi:hypothetical protein